MNNNKKILVIRLSSFGDIVLTFPFLKQVKAIFPQSTVYFLTKNSYRGLVELCPYIDRIITFNNDYSDTISLLRKLKFDYIFDLHKNIRSYLLSLSIKGKKFRYKKETFKKFLLVKFKINLFKKVVPVYRKYLETLKNMIDNIDVSYPNIDYKIDKTSRFNFNYIILAPSSKHYTKTYPTEFFIEIINRKKDNKFILVGDNSQRDINICKMIEQSCENVVNLCGRTDFKDLANLILNADYVICNDSGVLHFAELLGKKVYVFFGSTVKEFGFYPQLETTVIFENNNIKCRPCSRHGKDKCPKKHFKCMREINQNIL